MAGNHKSGAGPGNGPRYDYAAIAEAVRGGMTKADAARAFGCCWITVANACACAGLTQRRVDHAAIVRAVRGGMTKSEAARRFGCNRLTVHRICEAHGVPAPCRAVCA